MMLRSSGLLALFAAVTFAQTPTVTAVVNAESYLTQLCPGLVVAIYGSNFGTNAANVSVSVGGKTGYVYTQGILATQMDAQIPFEVPTGATTLTVTVGGVQSAPFNITLSAVSPSFLPLNGSGSGLATAYDASAANAVVTLTAPAHDGDAMVANAVGLGPTSPPTPTSTTGLAPATASTVTMPTVTVGGVAAVVAFAGVVQGTYSGFYQVNFKVPAGVQGTVPLVISSGGVSSSTTVTLATPGLSYVVNNASFASPGIASPGSIATVFANSLGATSNQTTIFPGTSSEGVQVTFNGVAAPLFHLIGSPGASSPQQIDLLVPSGLPTSGTVNVQLTTSTAFYANYSLKMVPSNPGFYRIQDPKVTTRFNVIAQFNGTAWLALPVSTTAALGLAACTSTTNVLSECGKPATIGDYLVLYCTGLGVTTPGGSPTGQPLATGAIPPADGSVLYETPTTPVVTIGGVSANVLFSGLAPGYPGEYEVVVQVPTGVTNGDDIPVTVSILGATDNSVTISIQPTSN
jgi:uncharacterized protein (TIGR03437 family)